MTRVYWNDGSSRCEFRGLLIKRGVIDALSGLPLGREDGPPEPSHRRSRNCPRSRGASPGGPASVSQTHSKGRKANAPPEGVTFRHQTDSHGRTNATFFKNGNEVGSADVRDLGLSIQITNFRIVRGARRQGIGTAFQVYIEAQLGKPAVPDGMLSNAEYRRWKKVDPVAVSDYVKGTKNYTPRNRSDGYFAAHGGRPVPGSRAAQTLSERCESVPLKKKPRQRPRGATVASSRKSSPMKAR